MLRIAAGALVAALFVASPPANHQLRSASGNALVITSYEYAFVAADTVRSGIVTVTLVNRGKVGHQLTIARLDDSTSMRRVMSTLVANKSRTDGVTWVGGVENALPGKSSEATVSLSPGRYLLVCEYPDDDGHAHVSKGMIRTLVVVPSRVKSDTVLPAARTTVRLTDYKLTLSVPLIAGAQRVRVQNDGPHRHHMIVGRVVGNATLAEIDRWDGKSLPAPIEDIGAGAAALDPGQASVITLDLKPGRYLLGCVLSDTAGAQPHYLLGMEKMIVVR